MHKNYDIVMFSFNFLLSHFIFLHFLYQHFQRLLLDIYKLQTSSNCPYNIFDRSYRCFPAIRMECLFTLCPVAFILMFSSVRVDRFSTSLSCHGASKCDYSNSPALSEYLGRLQKKNIYLFL